MPRKLAIVITATSRWATWESSWASTASSSGSSRRRSSPVVTQTTACFWFRPVAKAFGMSLWAIATAGLRHVGERHEPVDDAVELRRLLAGDDLAAHRVEGDLVGEEVLRRTRSRARGRG